jgi:transcriptional regulator with XRE-family HTH domain
VSKTNQMVTKNTDKINRMVRLVEIRKQQKRTISDIAYEIGVNPVSLSRYERGVREVPYKVYVMYAEALGYEVREILKH